MASHQSCFLLVSCICCTRCFLCSQLCNFGVEYLSFLSGPKHQFSLHLCGTCDLCHHAHSDSTHRRVFSNRQQWFAHWCLNTSNPEIGFPIIATHNLHSLPTFDNFSSCCAESEIIVTRNHRSVRDSLRPCRLSCTCVNSNLDLFRSSHLLSLLLKCVNVKITHVDVIDFDFRFNNRWFRVKIVSICILRFPFEPLLLVFFLLQKSFE